MSKQKKEEEKRILEEMDAAMQELAKKKAEESGVAPQEQQENAVCEEPTGLHCRRCKTMMENGVCPNCGLRMYVPMDPKKMRKIRLIAGCVFFAVFIVLVLLIK